MNAAKLDSALRLLHIRGRFLAGLLGYKECSVSRWRTGQIRVPESVAVLLRVCLAGILEPKDLRQFLSPPGRADAKAAATPTALATKPVAAAVAPKLMDRIEERIVGDDDTWWSARPEAEAAPVPWAALTLHPTDGPVYNGAWGAAATACWSSGNQVAMNRMSRPKTKRRRTVKPPRRNAPASAPRTSDKKKIARLTRELNDALKQQTAASRELSESLERETATSRVLGIISSSPTDGDVPVDVEIGREALPTLSR
jgi:hypothetical protein